MNWSNKNEYPYTRSWIEIDTRILENNARHLRSKLMPGVKAMAVIKSDAYGHGAVEVAKRLDSLFEMFAVADLHEAVKLRNAGIKAPLLVFAVPEKRSASVYKTYDLTAVVSDGSHFDHLERGTRYHVKIDTGMHRLGIDAGQLERVRAMIYANEGVVCTGIMTHFATADVLGSDLFARQGLELAEIIRFFNGRYMVHAANTAALLYHTRTPADMVRTGIALYGYDPVKPFMKELSPVMRWKSQVVQSRRLLRGEAVSYGAAWQAPETGYCATIPVGYSDGYPRILSGKLPVFLQGRWGPQVGRVTMEYIMVWLGREPVAEGAEVLVMGGERNHAWHWARAADTIPYEICCGISPGIPRIYV